MEAFANHEYSKGLPKLPGIQPMTDPVPNMPGDMITEHLREQLLRKQSEGDATTSQFENTRLLAKVTYGSFLPRHRSPAVSDMRQWEFEDRRSAQAILPFLYLGPASAAKDEVFLQTEGVSAVILVRDLRQEISRMLQPRTAQRLGIDTHIIEIQNERLVAAFPGLVSAINAHLTARFEQREASNEAKMLNREAPDMSLPAKILLYDLTGNEAAAAMACAYIMQMFGTNAGEAVFAVQSRRFCINASDCHHHLVRYHDILTAQSDTARARSAATAAGQLPEGAPQAETRGRKRELDDAIEGIENVSMLDGDDQASGTNMLAAMDPAETTGSARRISAPFADREEHDRLA